MTSHVPRSAMALAADFGKAVFGHRTHVVRLVLADRKAGKVD